MIYQSVLALISVKAAISVKQGVVFFKKMPVKRAPNTTPPLLIRISTRPKFFIVCAIVSSHWFRMDTLQAHPRWLSEI